MLPDVPPRIGTGLDDRIFGILLLWDLCMANTNSPCTGHELGKSGVPNQTAFSGRPFAGGKGFGLLGGGCNHGNGLPSVRGSVHLI